MQNGERERSAAQEPLLEEQTNNEACAFFEDEHSNEQSTFDARPLLSPVFLHTNHYMSSPVQPAQAPLTQASYRPAPQQEAATENSLNPTPHSHVPPLETSSSAQVVLLPAPHSSNGAQTQSPNAGVLSEHTTPAAAASATAGAVILVNNGYVTVNSFAAKQNVSLIT